MPRPRRTRPQNMGQNRNTQMRNNARRGGPSFSPNQRFQGGVGQGSGGPGVQPQPQQNNMQCPAGQQPGRGPNGRPTCVPSNQAGMPGASPVRTPGAGTPTRGPKKPYNEGY
jgi:hypothetical protein